VYVAHFVTFDRAASNANAIAILLLLLWIYYTAFVFLLGGGWREARRCACGGCNACPG
jgi:uncharacterized BrkB/YihY/UPF0761 family membrane protein